MGAQLQQEAEFVLRGGAGTDGGSVGPRASSVSGKSSPLWASMRAPDTQLAPGSVTALPVMPTRGQALQIQPRGTSWEPRGILLPPAHS